MEPSQVSAAERERTKHVVYAVIYGVGQSACAHMHMYMQVHVCREGAVGRNHDGVTSNC